MGIGGLGAWNGFFFSGGRDGRYSIFRLPNVGITSLRLTAVFTIIFGSVSEWTKLCAGRGDGGGDGGGGDRGGGGGGGRRRRRRRELVPDELTNSYFDYFAVVVVVVVVLNRLEPGGFLVNRTVP